MLEKIGLQSILKKHLTIFNFILRFELVLAKIWG